MCVCVFVCVCVHVCESGSLVVENNARIIGWFINPLGKNVMVFNSFSTSTLLPIGLLALQQAPWVVYQPSR